MRANELDQAYVLLSQTISRVPRESQELFLARLALLLLASHPEPETALAAVRDAEHAPGRRASVPAQRRASSPAP